MSFQEVQRKHTHREYLMWMAHLEEEWQQPKLTDYYLMQIACEVRRVLSKKPNRVKLKQFELKFENPKEQKYSEDKAKRSKQIWFGILGLKEQP